MTSDATVMLDFGNVPSAPFSLEAKSARARRRRSLNVGRWNGMLVTYEKWNGIRGAEDCGVVIEPTYRSPPGVLNQKFVTSKIVIVLGCYARTWGVRVRGGAH